MHITHSVPDLKFDLFSINVYHPSTKLHPLREICNIYIYTRVHVSTEWSKVCGPVCTSCSLQTSHYNVWNTVYQHTLTIHTIYTVRGGREETVREEGRCTNTDLWWGRGLAGTVCLWTGGVNKTSPHLPGHRVLIVTAKYGGGWALSRSPDWRDWERLGPLAYLCLRWWCTWTDKSRTWSCLDKLYFVELSPDWGDSASRYNYCQLSESRALPYGHTPLVKLLCACATIDQHSWQEELDFL